MTRPINYESGITLRPIIEQPTVAVVRRVSSLNLRLGLSSAQFLVVFLETIFDVSLKLHRLKLMDVSLNA